MAQLGADVAALDALAATLAESAGTLRSTGSGISAAITGAAWFGPDAVSFRGRWGSTHVPSVRAIATSVDELAGVVRRQAAEQRRASEATTMVAYAPAGLPGRRRDDAPLPGFPGDANRNGLPDWAEMIVGPPSSPYFLHTGDGEELIPQASEYDESRDEMLTTYYDEAGVDGEDIPGAMLSIQDRLSGSEQAYVQLVGADGTGGPAHAGGVATHGDFVYVTSENTVWVYRRDDIDTVGAGEPVEAYRTYEDIPATSFADIDDGRLYAGQYENGAEGDLYSYRLGSDGELVEDGGWFVFDGPQYEGSTPENAQGLEIVDDQYVFSQSHGVDDPTDLVARDDDGDDYDDIGEAAPISQGVNLVDGSFYVNSEGGADKFRDQLDEHGFDPPTGFEVIDVDDTDLDD